MPLKLERTVRSLLYPMTTPGQRRRLIGARDGVVGSVARARGRWGDRPLPDFVIAGVQKGGTTFLYQEMLRHPDVRGSLTKEVHFFDEYFDRGLAWYRGMFPVRQRADEVFGEASPAYVFHPFALRRLAVCVPAAKIIVILRDPIARARSHFAHERRLGFETCATLDEALAREDARVAGDFELLRTGQLAASFAVGHFAYARRGRYAEQLRAATELLGRERILVLFSEEMFAEPQTTVAAALEFVGVRSLPVPPVGANDMAFSSDPMSAAAEHRLREYFAQPNAELEEFLGRRLPWS